MKLVVAFCREVLNNVIRCLCFASARLFFIFAFTAVAAPPPGGVAPIGTPEGGFAIDGNLLANTPTPGLGDWILQTNFPGTGSGVLSADTNGAALNPQTTFHVRDAYNDSKSDLAFSGGQKWFDDPGTWTWTTSKPSSKTDINNALIHIGTDTNGHVWVVVAADRFSTSGDSYIDFEFLQNPLTRNANGTFSSSGPHGGRTTNDLLLSLAFTGGGSVPDFFVWRWLGSGSSFTYVDSTTSLPAGRVFAALNTNNTPAPYGAFGGMTYAANAFVEGALDLTALLGGFDPCLSVGFKTIMIKTKSSASSSASIEDFVDPIQYTLTIGPSANAGADQTRCSEGDSTAFPLIGVATPGFYPIASKSWSVVSGDVSIDDTNSLVTTARVVSGSAVLRLTAVQSNGCVETDDIVLTVQLPPVCSIAGVTNTCPRSTNTFSAPAGMNSYSWSVTGNGAIAGPANQPTVKVVAGSACGTSYSLSLATTTNVCTVSCNLDVAVVDNGAPVLTCPPDRVLDCPAVTTTNVTGVATATDPCSRATVSYSDEVTSGCGGTRTIARTWLATDECGNSVSCVQNITVRDITAPVLTCPTNRTLEFPADTSPASTGSATATDVCGSVSIGFADTTTTNCGNTFTISRLWTATDQCGNSSSCTQTITVRDTTAPVIACPVNVTLECPADTSTNKTGVATATDAGDAITISFSDSVTNLCGFTQVIKRTWTARDACNNQSSCTQTITVRDTTPPVITCVDGKTVECTMPWTFDPPTATDTCGTNTMAVLSTVTNKTCGNTFTATRTWRATDACGNQASCSQTVSVVDTTAPVITCAGNKTVECTSPWTFDAPTASDTCGSNSIVLVGTVTNAGCGNTFTATRTWRATDACGNQATCSQTVNVADTTPPVITCAPYRMVEYPAPWTFDIPTSSDTCGTSTVTMLWVQTNKGCGPTYTALAWWQATDACGNVAGCSQTTWVRDTTPPVITCGSNKTVECTAAWSFDEPTATDAGGVKSLVIAGTVTNLGCGNTYTATRTWAATDECDNKSTCSQTVTVVDTTPPVITCAGNKTVQCGSAWAFDLPTASDTCGTNNIAVLSTVTNKSCGNTLTATRTWRATDACGNAAQCSQTVTVVDTTPPTITCVANKTIECGTSWNFDLPTATDICGTNTITMVSTTTNAGCGNTFTATRTWRATDACGNTAQCSQTVTVVDTTAPVITCPASVTLDCPAVTTTNATGVATATDVCGTPAITFSDSTATTCGNAKVISRTWRATDPCGNSSTCVQTITVRDLTPPTITPPANITIECGTSTAPSATGNPTASDACNAVTVTYSDIVSNACGGTRVITRRWLAMDSCNNSNSVVQTITVRDTTPPALTLPASRVLDCPADTRTNVTGVATAVDVCGSVTIGLSEVVSNSCGGTKTIWRTWSATDQCGNSTNGVQTITVRDITAPNINCRAISVQCRDDVPPPYADLAAFLAAGGTATDGCDAALDFVMVSDSGLVGSCPGRVTRVYRVTDDCGNSSQCTQTITVNDTIAPVLTCPTSVTVECGTALDPANLGRVTATDNCSTNVAITNSDAIVDSSYNLKWYASDPDSGTGPFLPSYLKFAPSGLPCPGGGRAIDPLRNAVCFAANGQLDALTSMGNVPMSFGQIVPFQLVIEASGGPGTDRGTIEFTSAWSTYTTSNNRFGYDTNYMVYCAFVDPADPGSIDPNFNARVESFSSTVINLGTIAERIQGTFRVSGIDSGDRIIVEVWVVLMSSMPGNTGGTVAADLVAARKMSSPPQDISIGTQTVSLGNLSKIGVLPPPQSQPPAPPIPPQPPVPPGVTVSVIDRTWSATDECGNRGTCVQRITVRDTAPPIITLPGDRSLDCPADTSTNNTGTATALDACGSSVVAYSDVVSNGCGGDKTILRTWTATDQAGNSTNAVQTIVVQDLPPVITCPADINIECPATADTNVTGVATAIDACGTATVNYTDSVTNLCGVSRIISRTWTATDNCGRQSSCVQRITVSDTTPPALACKPAKAMFAGEPWSFDEPIATDACGAVTLRVINTATNVISGNAYAVVRTWEAADDCANKSTCQQIVTVTTPLFPQLQLVSANSQTVTYRWLAIPSGYELQSSVSMKTPNWRTVETSVVESNGYCYCVIPSSLAQQYFRLGLPQRLLWLDRLSPGNGRVCWSALLKGYLLETSDSLTAPNWSPLAATTVTTNTLTSVYLDLGARQKYFRLATPTAKLSLGLAAPGKVLLSWPALLTTYQLEASDSLKLPNWTPVAISPAVSNNFNHVEVPMDSPQKFFRLQNTEL